MRFITLAAALALAACSNPTPAQQAEIANGLRCLADSAGNIRAVNAASIIGATSETLLTDPACTAALMNGSAVPQTPIANTSAPVVVPGATGKN
jgi:hypothetical protein